MVYYKIIPNCDFFDCDCDNLEIKLYEDEDGEEYIETVIIPNEEYEDFVFDKEELDY